LGSYGFGGFQENLNIYIGNVLKNTKINVDFIKHYKHKGKQKMYNLYTVTKSKTNVLGLWRDENGKVFRDKIRIENCENPKILNEKMRLYHFSDTDFKILKPDFLGKNSFSKNESKFSLPRFFCYDTARPQEYIFKASNFRYTIRIKDKNIYNLDNDILGLKNRFNFDIDKILNFCAKKYHAIEYTTSFKTYAIFKEYRIFQKEALICGQAWE